MAPRSNCYFCFLFRARTRTAHLLGSTLDAWACSPVPGESGIAHDVQALLSATELGYWEIRGCCGRGWRDVTGQAVNLKTPIYYKYHV